MFTEFNGIVKKNSSEICAFWKKIIRLILFSSSSNETENRYVNHFSYHLSLEYHPSISVPNVFCTFFRN